MTNTLGSPTLGFQSFGKSEGASPTDGLTSVWIASTDAGFFFRGDPVLSSTSPGTNASGAYITSLQLGSNSSSFLCRGIFQGCYQYNPTVGRTVWSNSYQGVITGSTGDVKAYIIDDPDTIFLVQASTKGAVTSSMIGLNISVSTGSTTGNTTTGYSNITVESTSVVASSSYPFRLVDLWSGYAPGIAGASPVSVNSSVTLAFPNGTDNSNPANIVIVRLNNCDRLNLTARSS